MNSDLILILTSGRSGSTWIHSILKKFYEKEIIIERTEGKDTGYHPRKLFKSHLLGETEKIIKETNFFSKEIKSIEKKLKHGISYIDTGWVIYAALPVFISYFSNRLKILYLVRNPFKVAASWTNRGIYSKERFNDYIHKEAFLTPNDFGVFYPEFSKNWEKMNCFEKNLFNWAEIQLFAKKIRKKEPNIEWLEIKFEDIIYERTARNDLFKFLNLPYKFEIEDHLKYRIGKNKESLKKKWPIRKQWRLYKNVPQAVEIAKQFGYSVDKNGLNKLMKRYNVNNKILFYEYAIGIIHSFFNNYPILRTIKNKIILSKK